MVAQHFSRYGVMVNALGVLFVLHILYRGGAVKCIGQLSNLLNRIKRKEFLSLALQ